MNVLTSSQSMMEKWFDFSFINQTVISDYVSGIITTLSLAVFGVLIGIFLGMILSVMRLSKFKALNVISMAYVTFVRGTPLLLQLYMVVYGITDITGYVLNGYLCGIIAIGLNSAAYVSEMFRGGLNAVDKGQYEACSSLGLSYWKSLKLVIMPQAIKHIIPSIGNEIIVVIKETSIVSVIAIHDIMFYTKTIQSSTYNTFSVLILTALIYLSITTILTFMVSKVERRLAND